MADFIHTYLGIEFYPLEPKLEDIHIRDIAHALSLMTRANGHYKYFYSVAQHSINCYMESKARGYSKRVQLGCILHDASEAYISDITRPVKKNLLEYRIIEENLQNKIYNKFISKDLTREELEKIKSIDDSVLYYEFLELMGTPINNNIHIKTVEFDFSMRNFEEVENEFLEIFNLLM